MKNFTFADETLDLNRSESYKLSIQVNLDGFSFSILDMVRNKYILLKHYNLQEASTFDEKSKKIDHILKTDKNLQYSFKKNDCLVVGQKSILVPAPLFNERHLKKYFEFNHQLDDLDEIHYTYIDQLDAYNVFTIPNPISNSLMDKFNKLPVYHQVFPMLYYHLNFIHSDNVYITIHLYENFLEIMALNGGSLLFSNTFAIQNKEDVLYYILSVYKQFGLKADSHEIYISGTSFTENPIVSELKRYIKKVHFLKPPREFTYSYTFKKPEIHYFTNLFRLNLCV